MPCTASVLVRQIRTYPSLLRLRHFILKMRQMAAHNLSMTAVTFPSSWQDRPWLEQSWRRCLAQGRAPEEAVAFDSVPREALRRTEEANHDLLKAAQSALQKLGAAIASTRYFAILTDSQGVVIHTGGDIDASDVRASSITRVGVNLSEHSIGTSAIGLALHEQQPVWLHRTEHFFNATSVYSCAGAPLFSPKGQCIGMLDLTGIDAKERPELMHLVAHAASGIENTMVHNLPYALMVRVNWPGISLGEASDGLLALDTDGHVLGFNPVAKKMLNAHLSTHANDLFATPFEHFFDAARISKPCIDVPLWSGLRVNAAPLLPRQQPPSIAMTEQLPLKEVTSQLIKQAIQGTRGNVAEAARQLGISRATLYRKLAPTSQL